MTDQERRILRALRAVDANLLGLTPRERRMLRGCGARLAQALAVLGVEAPPI